MVDILAAYFEESSNLLSKCFAPVEVVGIHCFSPPNGNSARLLADPTVHFRFLEISASRVLAFPQKMRFPERY
jgi:hypothetical protein